VHTVQVSMPRSPPRLTCSSRKPLVRTNLLVNLTFLLPSKENTTIWPSPSKVCRPAVCRSGVQTAHKQHTWMRMFVH
jgi:hypothetical protein